MHLRSDRLEKVLSTNSLMYRNVMSRPVIIIDQAGIDLALEALLQKEFDAGWRDQEIVERLAP